MTMGVRKGNDRSREDEWQRRFSGLLERRARIADEQGFAQEKVERDVIDAVREARKIRAARRR
jgi:hypothetical protein